MSSLISRCSIGLAALLVSCALDPKTIGSETETAFSGSAEGSGGSSDGDAATGGTSGDATSQGSAGGSGDTGPTGAAATEGGAPMTCEELIAAFQAETEAIRSCDVASDCGQVLQGTSCGCTREWVARLDADTTMFFALLEALAEQECDFGIGSTCDCPQADGFDCVMEPEGAGRSCAWNYL